MKVKVALEALKGIEAVHALAAKYQVPPLLQPTLGNWQLQNEYLHAAKCPTMIPAVELTIRLSG